LADSYTRVPATPFSDRRVVVGIALLCCLLWASAVPGVKVGFELIGIAPTDIFSLLLFAGVRFTIAGVLLLAYAALSGKRVMLGAEGLMQVALLGLLSTALQYLFFYIGLAHSTGVKVSIMTSTSTFFSVLLAHVIYANDKLTWRRIVGCLLGFGGVVAVNIASSGLDLHFSFLGEGFIVIAALLFTIAAIYGKHVSQRMDVMVMTGWQLMLGGILLAIVGFAGGGHFQRFGIEATGLLAYLCVLSAAAFALWSLLLKHNPVGSIAIWGCLIPIFGTLLSGIILGESVLEWKNLVALVLVTAGIWLVTGEREPPLRAPAA
jgi:drug/metabolite transporter (DMT)-like permease